MEREKDGYDLEFYKSLQGEDALKARIEQGRLPIINIAGYPFFVDVRVDLLRPKDVFHTMGIELTENKFDAYTKSYYVYYHVPSMTEVTITRNATELPADVLMLKIPEKEKLDSVAMARINGKEPDERYLKRYPLKMYTELKGIPIEKTFLKQMVRDNLERQNGLQHHQPAIKHLSKRKGKGL